MEREPRHGVPTWVPRTTGRRLVLSVLIAMGTGWAVPLDTLPMRLLLGWDVGAAALLVMAWSIIATADEYETRARASAEDPGRRVAHLVVLASTTLSLFGTVAVLRYHASITESPHPYGWLGLSLAAVVCAWLLNHTTWTQRYAHLYYRDDEEGVGGLSIPSEKMPDDFDFAYFAFTIGMCFQVSDIAVTSRQIRRAVLVHSIQSFGFNTAILALALNVAFTLIG
jgi:uncharacterized membrane protein